MKRRSFLWLSAAWACSGVACDANETLSARPDPRLKVFAPVFASTYIGAHHRADLALHNAGPGSLEIDEIRSEHPDFTLGTELPRLLWPSDKVEIDIRFAPSSSGEVLGEL